VRHSGIAPDGEDGIFRVFSAAFCQPQVDAVLDILDPERCPSDVTNFPSLTFCEVRKSAVRADDLGGNLAHLPDMVDLACILGHHRLEKTEPSKSPENSRPGHRFLESHQQ